MRRIDHSPWCWLSKAAIQRAVDAAGPNGLAVLAALAKLESNAPAEAKAGFFASAQNLAAASGLTARSVFRVLPILQQARLFDMESGRRKAVGGYTANRFTLLDVGQPSPAPCDHLSYACDISVHPDGTHKRNSPGREKENQKPASASAPAKAGGAGGQEGESINQAFISWK